MVSLLSALCFPTFHSVILISCYPVKNSLPTNDPTEPGTARILTNENRRRILLGTVEALFTKSDYGYPKTMFRPCFVFIPSSLIFHHFGPSAPLRATLSSFIFFRLLSFLSSFLVNRKNIQINRKKCRFKFELCKNMQ